MFYTLPFDNKVTHATADTYLTVASLIVPDTAGVRCRIRSLTVGPAQDSQTDIPYAIKIDRIDDVSAGTAGTKTAVAVADIGKKDPGAPNSTVSGGVAYTVEPTTYNGEPLWLSAQNDRGTLIKEWGPEDAPSADADMLLGVLMAPRTSVAITVSGCIEFEVY